MSSPDEHFDLSRYLKNALLRCFWLVWTLYFNVRVRITAQIFRPDLGPVRLPLLPHLVAHVLINRNLLTSYVSVFIRKNILNSFLSWSKSLETNPCFSASHGFTHISSFLCLKLCYASYYLLYIANMQRQRKKCQFFLIVSLLLPILFTSRCSPLLLLRISFEVLFLNMYLGTLLSKKQKYIYRKPWKNMGNCNINRQVYN